MEASGELEKQRFKLIDSAVDALKSIPESNKEPQGFVIHEQIDHQERTMGLVPRKEVQEREVEQEHSFRELTYGGFASAVTTKEERDESLGT